MVGVWIFSGTTQLRLQIIVIIWMFCFLQSEWEKATDRRIKSNTIHRRVEKLMQRGTFSLEDRRERLVKVNC